MMDGNHDGWEKFSNHIVEVTKTRNTTIEAFSVGKSKSGSSRKESFPEDSQRKHQQRGRVMWRLILLARGSNYQNNRQSWQQQNSNLNRGGRYQHSSQRRGRYDKIEQKSSPQDCLGCCTSSGERSGTSKSSSRKTQTFSQKLRTS